MLKRELSDWPGGVESVWPLLDDESIRALRAGTPPDSRALRVSSELEEEELAGSAFVGNAMVLLRAVAEGEERLRVTSNGTLSLASVARMRAAMTWPDMEATEHFRDGTKYRERDLWELHLLRRMVQETGLIERGARSFELTALGRRMLEAGNRGALQALLFRVFFWHMDLSLFVGWLARRVPGRWPRTTSQWCSGRSLVWPTNGRAPTRSPCRVPIPRTRPRMGTAGGLRCCSCRAFSCRCAGSE